MRYLLKVKSKFGNRNIEDAIKSIRGAIGIDSSASEYHYYLSTALLKIGVKNEAAIEIIKAIELSPENDEYRKLKLSNLFNRLVNNQYIMGRGLNMADNGRITILIDGSGSGHSAAFFSETILSRLPEGVTNNDAEYNGAILALEHLPDGSKALILSDSELIVNR